MPVAAHHQSALTVFDETELVREDHYWNEQVSSWFEQGSLRFASRDGDFTLQLGGRLHVDFGSVWASDAWKQTVGSIEQNKAEVRRLRIYMQGELLKDFEYKWQVDFAGSVVKIKDAYLAAKDIGIGRLAAGQMKEPFSLEYMASSNDIMTMERSSMNALSPDRGVGIMLSNTAADERLAWFIGGFGDDGADTGVAVGTGGEIDFTARITGLPLYNNGGEDLVHVGLRAKYENPNAAGDIFYFSRGPTNLTVLPAVNTGLMEADSAIVYGPELAWIRGPFSLQGEYTQSNVDLTAAGSMDPTFRGWYGMVGYVLTGEHRRYDRGTGRFVGLVPNQEFGSKGYGAWELYGRVGQLDLEDASITGGDLDALTVGTNWYISRNMRVMMNYIHLIVGGQGRDGTQDILSFRWQMAF